ncbi:hypothetical protein IFM89_023520, partial [Coptis chinensis]
MLERVDLDLVYEKWEFKEVWKLNVPYKVRFFIWQGLQYVISTADILHMHHFTTDEYCVLCGFEKESHIYLFVHCPLVRSLWFGVDIHPLIYTATTSSFHDWEVNFVADAFAKWATNLATNQQWWANPNIYRDD